MQTLPNGVEVPTNSDTYKLTEDLANMGKTANVITRVSSTGERDGLPDKYSGMTVVRLDLVGLPLEIWDGTTWQRYSRSYAKAAGEGSLSVILAVNPNIGPVPVSFPPGRFTVPPIVTITSDQSRVIIVAANVTTTGFNVYATNVTTSDSGAGVFRWQAEQMTPTTAAG